MFGGELQLALAPLLGAAIVAFGLPAGRAGMARLVGGLGVAACAALLLTGAGVVTSGGRIETLLGTPIQGVELLLRLDLPGFVVALAATGATLLLVIEPGRQVREVSGLITCLFGSVAAALAGNAVMLFGGLEVANIGTLLLLGSMRGRPGRAGLAAVAFQHLTGLGLLAAAVQLEGNTGTTDFAVIPASAIGLTVAGPWALAAVARLLAPAFVPARGAAVPTAAWAATAAIPCGAIALLRLREAAAGSLPQQEAVALAALGAIVALGGAIVAARRPGAAIRTGRALCVVAAAPVVALAGIAGGAADSAVAAGLVALFLCVALTPAWERAAGRPGGVLGGAALVVAGGLPIGFGTTAIVLALAAIVPLGRPGALLLVPVGLGLLLGAAASVRAASALVSGERPERLPSPLGMVAAAVSLTAAVLPGTVAGTVVGALSGRSLGVPVGAAAIRTAAGGWAGGYLLLALAVLALGGWSLATLGVLGSAEPTGSPARVAPAGEPIALGLARRIRPYRRQAFVWADRVDTWLITQPQLALVVAGALIATLLIH